MVRLTPEQALAAAAQDRLVNIVSAPGSGKTTVAAERFGYQRHLAGDERGVLGLSFNRAAVAELRARISARWGGGAISPPHRVMTFDHLHVELLHRLLDAGLVNWPTGLRELDVRDDYRGTAGFRFLAPPSNFLRVAVLDGQRNVVSRGRRVEQPTTGIGNVAAHDALLSAGIVSHDDVRNILLSAMQVDELSEFAATWLAENYRALVIDEVYDAAFLDLKVAHLAAEAGLDVTLIGDPWQALYKWRGATPDEVQRLLGATTERFVEYQQPQSFRFVGDQMPELARALRNGEPVSLPSGTSEQVDVALARTWRPLWSAGDNILPLSFRTIENATDAALNLLLDVVTRGRLGVSSFGREAAIARLGLDRERFLAEQDRVLQPIVAGLRAGRAPADALNELRNAIRDLGVTRPRRLGSVAEAERVAQVERLAARLVKDSVVPGMTVFQAKGREWERVGVILTRAQRALLSTGLHELEDEHCVVYVALTRARRECIQLDGDPALDEGTLDIPADDD
ncbi:UvrD-helicase domain-containing protein [Microbacterium lacticum]